MVAPHPVPEVTLHRGVPSAHRQQIYTGFTMLARQGAIRLRQVFGQPCEGVAAEVDGRRLFFDVEDGAWIDGTELADCDAYFKRSFYQKVADALPQGRRIRPLGLNYAVYPDAPDLLGALRALRSDPPWRRRLASGARSLGVSREFVPRAGIMRDDPQPAAEPRVLFLTRAWQPNGRISQFMPARPEICEMRAACIDRIRREFGTRAVAGFAPSDYAARRFPTLVAQVPTDPRSYIRRLREFSIGVATTGLHGSTGWKLAEYVAFSKSIVAERLNYQAPHFVAGRHYLEFDDVDGCVENIGRLFDDARARRRMMYENQRYYLDYLRPDRLVWNAISASECSAPGAIRAL